MLFLCLCVGLFIIEGLLWFGLVFCEGVLEMCVVVFIFMVMYEFL